MKLTFYFLLSIVILISCESDSGTEPPALPPPVPIPFVVIQADSTDLPPKYSVTQSDQRLDSKFYFEENYFLDEDTYQFTADEGFFLAEYNGIPIRNGRVNEYGMCISSHNNCDITPKDIATLWSRIGRVSSDTLTWEYVDDAQKQGYRFELTTLPQPVRIQQMPSSLTMEDDQVIAYQKRSANDSIHLELIIVPKSELSKDRPIPFIDHARVFPDITADSSQIIIPVATLVELFNSPFAPTAEDTVFWNVATVRKVIKRVENQYVQITYQVNNLRPIAIE